MANRYSEDVHNHFIAEEGFKLESYTDHQGNWTIGIGHLLGRDNAFRGLRWSEEKVRQVFENDLDIALSNARQVFPGFNTMPPKVQLAIMDMLFNMGLGRFRGFKKTIRLLNSGLYAEAAVEAMDSEWAKHDVPNRAARVTKLLSNA